MESNKDEAWRCVGIAKEAISAGNKERALKFIGIARRLNENLPLEDLLASCENLNSRSSAVERDDVSGVSTGKDNAGSENSDPVSNGERSYTEENVQLVREIKSKRDYYAILGLERNCSVEEVRKAYRKLSLKVHPDKNKAPGSEEAFKKVSKAFKCLSEEESKQQYDQTGLVDEFERDEQYQVRRRRRTANDFYSDDFDPDEIFRAFFGDRDVFRNAHVYRTRARSSGDHHSNGSNDGVPNIVLLLQLLPFLFIILLAYLPSSEPEYSLQKNYNFQFKKMTEKHGLEFFVKSSAFDEHFPIGTPSRHEIEGNVIKDYKNILSRYCHVEMQRRQWNRHLQTPHCDRLESVMA